MLCLCPNSHKQVWGRQAASRAQILISSPGVRLPREGRGPGLLPGAPTPALGPGLGGASEEALKAAGEGQPQARLQLGPPSFDLPSAFRLLPTSAINLWLQCWPGPWQAAGGTSRER